MLLLLLCCPTLPAMCCAWLCCTAVLTPSYVAAAPLLSNTAGDVVVREDYQTAQLVALILELLGFCVEHHSYHMKNYIIHRDLLHRVLVLIKSKHTFLVLCEYCRQVSSRIYEMLLYIFSSVFNLMNYYVLFRNEIAIYDRNISVE